MNTIFNYIKNLNLNKIGIFILSVVVSTCALANPEGGQVVSGNIAITAPDANTVQINQTSQKGIIDWRSFNIGNAEHTHFAQPTNGVTLNRIDGAQGISQIFGKLSSTGQIILINPAGIHFGPNAYVNVGGIIASTSGISNENFLAGNYVFDQASPLNGTIVNQGIIHLLNNGLAAFLATNVSNEGVIESNLGHVILATGAKFTINLTNDGLIHFVVAEGTTQDSHISNTGSIIANGGKILISSKAASAVLDNVINIKGVVHANSVGLKNGEIVLLADGGKSKISVAGNVSASGYSVGSRGGKVVLSAQTIELLTASIIDVSGHQGGGEILLGGDKQGALIKPYIANANSTIIAAGATLLANAVSNGDGGKIIVWADGNTWYSGHIEAKGGSQSGNGGFAEVSGKKKLSFTGSVNLGALHGMVGTLLLDPENLTIQTSGTSTTSLYAAPGTAYVSNVDSSILLVSDLQNALANASVLVQTGTLGSQAGDITVADNVTWSNANTLTLSAYRHVVINNGVAITNNANGSLVMRADNTGTGTGTISMNNANALNISGTGTVSIFYNPSSYTTPTTFLNSASVSPATLTAYMLVNSMTDLSNVRNALNGNFALGKSLDASSVASFTPIGNNSTPFTGNFNGNFNTISNLTIDTSSGLLGGVTVDGVGLFGVASNARLQNIILRNVAIANTGLLSIAGIGSATGGLVGYATGTTAIQNAYVSGSVSYNNILLGLNSHIGGVVGYANSNVTMNGVESNSTVASRSQISAIVGALSNVGGLAGTNAGTITNASASGTVAINGLLSIAGSIGGLVGTNSGAINTSYSVVSSITGSLIALTAKGGFIGAHSGSLSNDYWNSQLLPGFSTCGVGTCTNAVARTTVQMQTQGTYTGFNFSSTWGINSTNHGGYPYLQVFAPRVISGTLPSTGGTINLYNNGTLVSNQVIANGTGTFSFSTDFGTIADNDVLLLYLSGYSTVNNVVAIAPLQNSSLTDLNMTANNQLTMGGSTIAAFTNSTLATAAGALSTTDLLYSVSGNNLTIGNATNPNINLTSSTTSTYSANGTVGYTGGGTGNLLFNGAVSLEGNTITNTGNQTYSSTVSLNAGTSLVGAALSLQNVQLGSNNLSLNTSSALSQISSTVSGTGGLIKLGTGTVTLSGSNTYSGMTTITTGSVVAANANALGSIAAGTTVAAGANLQLSSAVIGAETVTLNGTGIASAGALTSTGTSSLAGNIVLNTSSSMGVLDTSLTLSGEISGANNLTKVGSGTLILSGTNTYSGSTTINAGTLQLGAANVIADASAVILANTAGAILDLNNFNETIGSLSGGGATGGNVLLGSAQLTLGGDNSSTSFAGVISGSGDLVKVGTGALTLSGTNTYTGTTSIDVGSVIAANASALGTIAGGTTVANGANLQLTNISIGAESLTLNGTGIAGAGALTSSGTSALAGTILLNTDTTVGVANTSLTLSGVISGIEDLTKIGTGTLILSGTNTYTGSTTINAGTLQLGAANVIADASAVILANTAGAALDLNNFNETIGSLSGGGATGGNVLLGSAQLTLGGDNSSTSFAGVISGSGDLVKVGTGALTLSGTNTYTGTTSIDVGSLIAANASALGTIAGGTTVANGANLQLTNLSIGAESLTLNGSGIAGAGALTSIGTSVLAGNLILNTDSVIGVDSTSLTLNGIISGSGDLSKIGAGELILSGNNLYSGATSIEAGMMTLLTENGLGASSAINVAVGAALVMDFDNALLANTSPISLGGSGIASGGALILDGTGIQLNNNMTLTSDTVITSLGANTFNGMINGGFDLTMNSPATGITLPSITLTNNSNLIVDANGAITQSGVISAQSLAANAIADITLTGLNTINDFGAFTVNGNIALNNTANSLNLSDIQITGNGAVAINNTGELVTTGTIAANGGDVSLSTLPSGSLYTGITINADITTNGGAITINAANNTNAPTSVTVNGLLSTLGGSGTGVLTADTGVVLNVAPVLGAGNITFAVTLGVVPVVPPIVPPVVSAITPSNGTIPSNLNNIIDSAINPVNFTNSTMPVTSDLITSTITNQVAAVASAIASNTLFTSVQATSALSSIADLIWGQQDSGMGLAQNFGQQYFNSFSETNQIAFNLVLLLFMLLFTLFFYRSYLDHSSSMSDMTSSSNEFVPIIPPPVISKKLRTEEDAALIFEIRSALHDINGFTALLQKSGPDSLTLSQHEYLVEIMINSNDIFKLIRTSYSETELNGAFAFDVRTSVNNIMGYARLVNSQLEYSMDSIKNEYLINILVEASSIINLLTVKNRAPIRVKMAEYS